MIHGNEELRQGEWQEVPGSECLAIFPYIRKIDTVSSNTYLIDHPRCLVIIDPGGLAEQADAVLAIAEKVRRARPILTILTHVHIDHCIQALFHPGFRQSGTFLAAHEYGARALEGKDTEITQARLFSQALCDVKVGMRLFGEKTMTPGGFTLYDRDIPLNEGGVIRTQVLSPGGGEGLQLFHTPGHSPDSICIRAGHLLFTGDLLFAANPGIAGLSGWSQDELVSSIRKVIWLLGHEDISICCPGHGKILPAVQALEILKKTEIDAAELTGIKEVNPEWALEMAGYADDLMAAVSEMFTVIAGRLFVVSHILEELEESGESERIRALISPDAIDALIEDFSRFAEEYRAGRRNDIHLALKAGQIVQKLDDLFGSDGLGSVLDPSLIRRTGRLLSDYLTIFRGFQIKPGTEILDLNEILENRLRSIETGPYTEKDLLELSDNEERFQEALVSRLAFVPVLRGIPLILRKDPDLPGLIACGERLPDLIQGIVEELAGNEPEDIVLETSQTGSYICLSLAGRGVSGNMADRKERFFKRECLSCGGELTFVRNTQDLLFSLVFPAAPCTRM